MPLSLTRSLSLAHSQQLAGAHPHASPRQGGRRPRLHPNRRHRRRLCFLHHRRSHLCCRHLLGFVLGGLRRWQGCSWACGRSHSRPHPLECACGRWGGRSSPRGLGGRPCGQVGITGSSLGARSSFNEQARVRFRWRRPRDQPSPPLSSWRGPPRGAFPYVGNSWSLEIVS